MRYKWNQRDGKKLNGARTSPYNPIDVPMDKSNDIFVNILEQVDDNWITWYKVRLYYANGSILEGWTTDVCFPIELSDTKELFDGRFNG